MNFSQSGERRETGSAIRGASRQPLQAYLAGVLEHKGAVPPSLSPWENSTGPSTSFSVTGAAVLGCRAAWAEMLSAPCNVRHAYLVRCLFGKTRRRHPCAPNAGMRCGLPASSRQCGRCLGWSSTCAEAADTSEPPNASPIPHHRSGFDRRAAYDIPRSVPALANANDPNMDDQPKTRLICRRCAARMKLARQLPWLDHKLPAVLLFQCIDWACRHARVARPGGRIIEAGPWARIWADIATSTIPRCYRRIEADALRRCAVCNRLQATVPVRKAKKSKEAFLGSSPTGLTFGWVGDVTELTNRDID